MLYPWTHSQWQQLVQRVREHRLPHAILFGGIEGLGKFQLATQFAQSILCEHPDKEFHSCQSCRSCIQFTANTHPDFILIEPEEEGKAIKVDQIRKLTEQFGLASHYQGYRIAIINPAESMNLAAANSLLKSLEEPPERTLIILVSSNSALLPSTILSRCQQVSFATPSRDIAINWLNKQHNEISTKGHELLAMANGAPLKAVYCADGDQVALRDELFGVFVAVANGRQSPLSGQNQWLKTEIATPIQWVYSWVSDLIKLKNHLNQAIVNHDKLSDLQKLAHRVELGNLYAFLDKLLETLRKQRAPLNTQMIMDDLLLDWQVISSEAPHPGLVG